jgi:hypothetical protein
MEPELAEQLIEQADPTTFEEFAFMRIRCVKLHRMGKLGMSNVFVQFSRERGHIWEGCGGTESVKNDLSPVFEPLILSLHKMCHSKFDRKIKIEAMETATSDGHKPVLIGQLLTTPAELMARSGGGGNGFEFDLVDPVKAAKSKSYKNSGTILFDSFQVMLNTTKGLQKCWKECLLDGPTQCHIRFQMQGKAIEKMDLFGKVCLTLHRSFRFAQ